MKDLTRKIDRIQSKMLELRTQMLEEIKEWVNKHGKLRENGDRTFSIDSDVSEVLDPVRILVQVDRHTGDMNYEGIESITVNTKGEVFIETSSYFAAAENEVNFADLVETYDYINYFEKYGLYGLYGLVIEDGRLKVAEEDDE